MDWWEKKEINWMLERHCSWHAPMSLVFLTVNIVCIVDQPQSAQRTQCFRTHFPHYGLTSFPGNIWKYHTLKASIWRYARLFYYSSQRSQSLRSSPCLPNALHLTLTTVTQSSHQTKAIPRRYQRSNADIFRLSSITNIRDSELYSNIDLSLQ